MNYKYTIPTAIIGLSIAFLQPPAAKAICSNDQVDATAEKITVLIDSPEPGSGVIIKKEGNTYTVLTANHVVKNQNFKYAIVTPDKQRIKPKADDFLVQAGDKYGKGDYRGAILAYYARGYVRLQLGDNKGAIQDYTQAININPNDAKAYYNRGLANSNLGDKQAAIQDYTQAININPNYANAYYNRGLANSNLGDKFQAISDFQQAAKIYQQQSKNEDYQDALNRIRELQE
jgi:tetratricopeptide (TPR) repeat protein